MLYCEENFDVKTMELVGVFVKRFRCFDNQFFSLHPLIKGHVSKEKGEYTICLYDNKEFDLFREKKLNVMALCGKNGCGKTTLINKIRSDFRYGQSSILFFIDAQKKIATSEVIEVVFEGRSCAFDNTFDYDIDETLEDDNSEISFDDYEDENEKFSDSAQIFFKHYLEFPRLFSFENDGELLTHYEIQLDSDRIRGWIKRYLEILPRFYDDTQKNEKKTIINHRDSIEAYDHYVMDYPLYSFVISYLGRVVRLYNGRDDVNLNPFGIISSNSFEEMNKKIRERIQRIDEVDEKLRDFLFLNAESYLLDWSIPYKRRKIESSIDVKEQMKWLTNMVWDILDDVNKILMMDNHNSADVKELIHDAFPAFKENLFSIKPYKVMDNGIRRLSDLSEGQKRSLINRQKIFDCLKEEKYTIVFDEPENAYHPEMSRWFWADLVKEVEFTKKYLCNEIQTSDIDLSEKKKKIRELNKRYVTIIVATHSPFLLSDLFKHNILALENQGDGFVREANIRNTFAGNIAEILCDSMFMNGMVGAFAEQQIQSLFRKKIKDETDLNNRKQLVGQIGDPILKNILMGELASER